MSKKGVSADEKKSRMLQLFYETGECFQLKELEKIAPKEKGIIANAVKDVIQRLVEDGLVDTDKIGNAIFFWAFPSKTLNQKKQKLEMYQSEYNESSEKLQLLEKNIADSKSKDSDCLQQIKILEEINDTELELYELQTKLREQTDNDPKKVDILLKKSMKLKDAANRWTDNIFTVKSWSNNKFFTEEKVLNKQFGIPEDLDYID